MSPANSTRAPRARAHAATPLHRFGLLFAYALSSEQRSPPSDDPSAPAHGPSPQALPGGHAPAWRPLGWKDLQGPPSPGASATDRLEWIHFDLRHAAVTRWLRETSGIDPQIIEAMVAKAVYPHLLLQNGQMLLVLKGVNFAPGAPPGELISLRLFCDGHRLITCRREPVHAITALKQQVLADTQAQSPGDLIPRMAALLVDPMDDVVLDLLDQTHRIGHAGDRGNTESLVATLAHLRRTMIRIHSHLSRQRRVLAELGRARLSWLADSDRQAARNLATQLNQHMETLAAAQEITEITQDEILQRSSERTERRLFSLTVITAVFLPLTFITGLLGVNLAGIPDASDPVSFLILCLLLAAIVALQLWYLRKKNWL